MINLNTVNITLKKLGAAETLVKGEGYFYFIDGQAAEWETSSVYVYKVNDLTLDQWIEEYRTLKAEGDKRLELHKLMLSHGK